MIGVLADIERGRLHIFSSMPGHLARRCREGVLEYFHPGPSLEEAIQEYECQGFALTWHGKVTTR